MFHASACGKRDHLLLLLLLLLLRGIAATSLPQVCLAMYMPNLVRYFLYSNHVCGSLVADFLIALLRSEIHCAANFCRNFFWTSEYILLRGLTWYRWGGVAQYTFSVCSVCILGVMSKPYGVMWRAALHGLKAVQ